MGQPAIRSDASICGAESRKLEARQLPTRPRANRPERAPRGSRAVAPPGG